MKYCILNIPEISNFLCMVVVGSAVLFLIIILTGANGGNDDPHS